MRQWLALVRLASLSSSTQSNMSDNKAIAALSESLLVLAFLLLSTRYPCSFMTEALPIMRADPRTQANTRRWRSRKPDVPAVLPPNTDYRPTYMAGAPRWRCLRNALQACHVWSSASTSDRRLCQRHLLIIWCGSPMVTCGTAQQCQPRPMGTPRRRLRCVKVRVREVTLLGILLWCRYTACLPTRLQRPRWASGE
jgi:hypothetical protein